MKKSQSYEILALVILAIILMVYVVMTYLVKPVKARIEETETQITAEETELRTAYGAVEKYASESEKMSALSAAVSGYAEGFLAEDRQGSYLDHISVSVTDCKVTFTSLSALEGKFKGSSLVGDESTADKVFALLSQDDTVKKTSFASEENFRRYFDKLKSSGGRLEEEIRTTTMTVETVGPYQSVLKFLKSLTSGGKRVLCNTMTLEMAENVSLRTGNNPETRLVVTLVYVEMPGAGALCTVPEVKELPKYVFPKDILDGSYRSAG